VPVLRLLGGLSRCEDGALVQWLERDSADLCAGFLAASGGSESSSEISVRSRNSPRRTLCSDSYARLRLQTVSIGIHYSRRERCLADSPCDIQQWLGNPQNPVKRQDLPPTFHCRGKENWQSGDCIQPTPGTSRCDSRPLRDTCPLLRGSDRAADSRACTRI